MGFSSVNALVRASLEGRSRKANFRKVPGFASTANWWVDLSMAAGTPAANFYASSPLEAAALNEWKSIYHGDALTDKEMYLTRLSLMSSGSGMVGQFKLLDYLLYYPFVDGDSTDPQPMDNTLTLDRCADGAGVMAMAVSQAPTGGSGIFTFEYVNQNGATKTSPAQYCGTTSAPLGSLITSQPATVAGFGPFLNLAGNDTGIRQINSITFSTSNGGLCAIVLVKPLIDVWIREISTEHEFELLTMRCALPRIYDTSFLGFIAQTGASVASAPLVGRFDYAWDEGD
jgi:hypothetical protein